MAGRLLLSFNTNPARTGVYYVMARTKLMKMKRQRPRKLMGCMKASAEHSSAYYPPHGEARDWSDTEEASEDEENVEGAYVSQHE